MFSIFAVMNASGKCILLVLSFTLIEANIGKISIFNYPKEGFSCEVGCIPQCQNSGIYQNGTCMCPDDYSRTRCKKVINLDIYYRLLDN